MISSVMMTPEKYISRKLVLWTKIALARHRRVSFGFES